MKLVYSDMGHILRFGEGYVPELVIENKKMFFNMVDSMARQADPTGESIFIHGACSRI